MRKIIVYIRLFGPHRLDTKAAEMWQGKDAGFANFAVIALFKIPIGAKYFIN
jgi:hypothetical protein